MSALIPFTPASKEIAAITVANPGVVTTTTAHGYNDGLYVQLFLPGAFGMNQVRGKSYLITVLSPTTFSLNASTLNFDAFTTSSIQKAQVIPFASVASTLVNAEQNASTPISGT